MCATASMITEFLYLLSPRNKDEELALIIDENVNFDVLSEISLEKQVVRTLC